MLEKSARTLVLCPSCGRGYIMDIMGWLCWCPYCFSVAIDDETTVEGDDDE